MLNQNSYWIMMMVILVILIERERRRFCKEKEKLKLLRQMEHFLGEIRHHYYMHGMIDEAIYDILPSLKGQMETEANMIFEILDAKDMEEEVEKYNALCSNRFLKTFLALCVTLVQFGDQIVDKQSLFLTNTKNLKQEIGIEILKREKINYLFSGLMVLVLAPGFFIKLIENWGIGNLPELSAYYHGAFGIVGVLLIFVSTIVSYGLINGLREMEDKKQKKHFVLQKIQDNFLVEIILDYHTDKNYGKYLERRELLRVVGENLTPKQLVIKQYLFFIVTLFVGVMILNSIHWANRNQYLTNTGNISSRSISASPTQINQMTIKIKEYTLRYKNQKMTKEQIQRELEREGVIRNKAVMTMTSDEIYSRIGSYQNEKIRWFEILIVVFCSLTAYFVPGFLLLYRKKVRQMGMEDEVIQFHSIILMLMYMDHMTVDIILEWMERFAYLFAESIRECVSDFSSGEEEALTRLKENEPFLPFARIVENFIICDIIGIEKAFDEIAVERVNYQEKRKQENEIYINNKAIWGKLIAYIPLLMVVGMYLIVPFIVESLSQLLNFMTQIDSM